MRRPQELEGFTLFRKEEGRWQMSVRRLAEPGWSVSQISEEQAMAVLALLEASGHPDGPWAVREGDKLEDELWQLGRALRRLSQQLAR